MSIKPIVKDLGLQFGSLSRRSSTRRGVQHHMEANGGARDCHAWHKANGWSGCGYHIVVRKDGTIEQGRPLWAVGAHAEGANSDSVGVSVEGSYQSTSAMPDAQFAALVSVWWWLFGKYGFGVDRLYRHKDVGDTSCPGARFPWARLRGALKDEGKVIAYIATGRRNLYKGPKARAKNRIRKLPKGTIVLYAKETDGAWRKVRTLDGTVGWVKSTRIPKVKAIKAIRDGR